VFFGLVEKFPPPPPPPTSCVYEPGRYEKRERCGGRR
jgi:hypothetical protein